MFQNATESLRLKSDYLKVRIRRAEMYEDNDQPHESMEDWKLVLEVQPDNKQGKAAISRLPAKIEVKNEKLKEEMFDGMKKLGNMCLKPFGLSTDNFKLGTRFIRFFRFFVSGHQSRVMTLRRLWAQVDHPLSPKST